MAEVEIRAQQVWRYRDERENRQVVVDSTGTSGDPNPVLEVHNEATGRKSRIRAAVLVKHYRLVEGGENGGS